MTTTKRILLLLAEITDDVIALHRNRYPGRNLFDSFPNTNKNTVYSAVKKLLSAGKIEKIVVDGEVYYRITSQGWDKLKSQLSLTKWQRKPWDSQWRVLIFDIAEKRRGRRDALRRQLCQIGFGHLQRSVWISPFNVVDQLQEILAFQGLSREAVIFRARRIGEKSNHDLAEKAWPLFEISERYDDLIWELTEANEKYQHDTTKIAEANEKYIAGYLNILKDDPCLPRELLQKYWRGFQAQKIFQQTATHPTSPYSDYSDSPPSRQNV